MCRTSALKGGPGRDGLDGDETGGGREVERIPDPRLPEFGAQWDAGWERSLRLAALERVRETVDPGQFRIFDLYVLKQQPAREVAGRLGVGVARVYLVKQRMAARLRREMHRLEQEADRGLRPGGGSRRGGGSTDNPPRRTDLRTVL